MSALRAEPDNAQILFDRAQVPGRETLARKALTQLAEGDWPEQYTAHVTPARRTEDGWEGGLFVPSLTRDQLPPCDPDPGPDNR